MRNAMRQYELEPTVLKRTDKQTMKTSLNFEQDDTKKLLAKLDFEFFLKQNIVTEKYQQADIDKIYSSYQQTLNQISDKAQTNKKQQTNFKQTTNNKQLTTHQLNISK